MQSKSQRIQGPELFGQEKIGRTLLRLAPPVMFSQLIQALYNMVDSYFVGRLSADGLTALSAIFPAQLCITAIAVGTGTGVGARMAQQLATDGKKASSRTAGTGMVLAALSWALFSCVTLLLLPWFARVSVQSETAMQETMAYGYIVCFGSFGVFLESMWSKVLQAEGNMLRPMIAQVVGAGMNILLDPILIFGLGPVPAMGIRGAALATISGQIAAAIIVGSKGVRKPPREITSFRQDAADIYRYGYPSIFMQLLYVVYIMALNVILAQFSDAAVTVLGLYYKLQTFFFIPLFALQTCIVPVLSYNYARAQYRRCKRIIWDSAAVAGVLMLIGVICFEGIPGPMIRLFTRDAQTILIGIPAFRMIALSFLPAVLSLIYPVVFQAVGKGMESAGLSLLRQIICLLPAFYLLSRIGLSWCWLAFPIAEIITAVVGTALYLHEIKAWKKIESVSTDTAINI